MNTGTLKADVKVPDIVSVSVSCTENCTVGLLLNGPPFSTELAIWIEGCTRQTIINSSIPT